MTFPLIIIRVSAMLVASEVRVTADTMPATRSGTVPAVAVGDTQQARNVSQREEEGDKDYGRGHDDARCR